MKIERMVDFKDSLRGICRVSDRCSRDSSELRLPVIKHMRIARSLQRGFLDFLFYCRPILLRRPIIWNGYAKEADQKTCNRFPHVTFAARQQVLTPASVFVNRLRRKTWIASVQTCVQLCPNRGLRAFRSDRNQRDLGDFCARVKAFFGFWRKLCIGLESRRAPAIF
jgi:hypothetical protein